MNKQQLIKQIQAEVKDYSLHDIELIIDNMFEIIENSVLEGEDVRIRNFGTFKPKLLKAYVNKTSIDNSAKKVPGRVVVKFEASAKLRKVIEN